MMRTLVRFHLELAFLFFLIFETSASALSIPRPIPANEWIVTPPMLQAAMPVEAVTATASGVLTYSLRRVLMISRRRTDLPVPTDKSALLGEKLQKQYSRPACRQCPRPFSQTGSLEMESRQ
ncbi:hypothetical protein EI94DRAFT_1729461 [Lactarius quietus]|nr:hypothetical protein EI94DRAFT_1729461 [Lactarius quietus]